MLLCFHRIPRKTQKKFDEATENLRKAREEQLRTEEELQAAVDQQQKSVAHLEGHKDALLRDIRAVALKGGGLRHLLMACARLLGEEETPLEALFDTGGQAHVTKLLQIDALHVPPERLANISEDLQKLEEQSTDLKIAPLFVHLRKVVTNIHSAGTLNFQSIELINRVRAAETEIEEQEASRPNKEINRLMGEHQDLSNAEASAKESLKAAKVEEDVARHE